MVSSMSDSPGYKSHAYKPLILDEFVKEPLLGESSAFEHRKRANRFLKESAKEDFPRSNQTVPNESASGADKSANELLQALRRSQVMEAEARTALEEVNEVTAAQAEEIAELRRSSAFLSAAEAERLDLRRRYLELGERFECLVARNEADHANKLAQLNEQQERQNQETAEKLHVLLEEVENQRQSSQQQIKSIESLLADKQKELDQFKLVGEALDNANSEIREWERRDWEKRVGMHNVLLELGRIRTELKSIKKSVQDGPQDIVFGELATVAVEGFLTRLVNARIEKVEISRSNLEISSPGRKFVPVHSAAQYSPNRMIRSPGSVDQNTPPARRNDRYIPDDFVLAKSSENYSKLEEEHQRLLESKKNLEVRFSERMRPLEAEVAGLRAERIGHEREIQVQSLEVSRLNREVQRLKDLVTSKDRQLAALMDSRVAHLRASFKNN